MKKTTEKSPRPVKLSSLLRKLGAFQKLETLPSLRLALLGGSSQQYILRFEKGEIMQSYGAIVGVKFYAGGELYLTPYHDYSKTTMAYCGNWCGISTQDRRKGLERGKIRLAIA